MRTPDIPQPTGRHRRPRHRPAAHPAGDVRSAIGRALRAAGVAAVCGLALTLPGDGGGAPVAPRGDAGAAPAAGHGARTTTDRERPAPASPDAPEAAGEAAAPVRVRIPAIGVSAPVGPLTVGPGRVLPPPSRPAAAGWWQGGPEPGEAGAAVIVGHYDSETGPAVFHRLAELSPGDRITVGRADGTAVAFTVRRLASHPQDDFPTDRVYGDTGGRQALRLITCSGPYDHAESHYEENLIVFAEQTP